MVCRVRPASQEVRGDGYRIEVVTEPAKSHSDSKQAAQQADFIVFPITCLVLEVQLDAWSLIEQYGLNLSNLVGKVVFGR